MKKETIFKHEINESIQANAALNCLRNRNTPKKLNESADFDARFEFRKDLRELASPVAKKAYMIIRKQYGDSMWRQLHMDDCDERGLIDMLNMYAEKGLNPQQIVNKMLGVREDEEEEDTLNAYYSQDEPDYENDHHGIWLIINLMRKQGLLRAQGIEGRDDVDDGHAIDAAYDLIEQKLNEEGMWIGDDDHEAERFVSFYGEEIAAEAMKSAIHNQEQEETTLDTQWFTDLEEQEAYYENFRAIAELVADQIDRENGNGIANNMDTLFEIIREVWDKKPDDLYIWDFDDVQENDCYKFFDKYYEVIKNEYLKREHNNIMAATHDDLFASEQEEDAEDFISNVVNLMEDEGMIDETQWDAAYYTVEEMIQSNPELKHYPSYMQFLNVFGDDILSSLNNQEQEELPEMERHDLISVLTQYLDECWIDDNEDGDLDELYYAVAKVLDRTGDYPASTDWEDCKPWCEKHRDEVVQILLGGRF